MSKSDDNSNRNSNSEPKSSESTFKPKSQSTSKKVSAGKDYKVGYGKPPLHTRFEKGKSGNEAGSRKKRMRLDIREQVQDIFVAPVLVRDGKMTRRAPKIIALLEHKLNESFKDPHARALPKLLQLAHEFRVFDIKKEAPPAGDLSGLTDEEREEFFDHYTQIQRLIEKAKKSR